MRDLRIVLRFVGAQNRIFVRTPVGAFFTIGLPLIMLVLFVAMFGNDELGDTQYGRISTSQFYAPGLAVFAAASATYTNIGMNLSNRRDLGILKRVRGTPVAPWMYMSAVVISGMIIAFVSMVVMVGIGVVAYGINIEAAKVPAMAVSFAIGSACFATLGVAVAALAKTAASAQSMTSASLLPLGFISNVFVSFGSDTPGWLEVVGDIFPLKHFAISFSEAMSPFSDSPAFEWDHLAVMVAWMALGAVVALKRFRWEPVPGAATSRSRRNRRSRT